MITAAEEAGQGNILEHYNHGHHHHRCNYHHGHHHHCHHHGDDPRAKGRRGTGECQCAGRDDNQGGVGWGSRSPRHQSHHQTVVIIVIIFVIIVVIIFVIVIRANVALVIGVLPS